MPTSISVSCIRSLDEFCTNVMAQLEPSRSAPRNLDGLADVLREFHVTRINCSSWQLSVADSERVMHVLVDERVALVITP
ncbi:hypothetical protein CIP107534_01694 [Corynebacterium diphtheriae]|uniref:hypothetical protein n=1 Tax=Corynebacterium diphtheriae TaxID=1717 RepID=UPI0013CCDB81|nr:hypothetical protein CIP101352_01713 [Corynebacterium diphtheriae]CAB0560813.1 hypothetical protein CIP107514_01609 [Corynebacterium diphtheriae]CAB0572356.1 hypothetical protein CIP107534_01694 [Corynebacterium diphtheriae]CAB0810088.1 hypothetical protein FRC0263_01778 [Corynebacterium diphtheriae]